MSTSHLPAERAVAAAVAAGLTLGTVSRIHPQLRAAQVDHSSV
jgi:hypothetical protein